MELASSTLVVVSMDGLLMVVRSRSSHAKRAIEMDFRVQGPDLKVYFAHALLYGERSTMPPGKKS